jgi:hypothetical protein
MATESKVTYPVVNLAKYQMDTMKTYGNAVALVRIHCFIYVNSCDILDKSHESFSYFESYPMRHTMHDFCNETLLSETPISMLFIVSDVCSKYCHTYVHISCAISICLIAGCVSRRLFPSIHFLY